MVRHADPRIGTELAGYRIESLLGRGGRGVVYLAEQVRLKRKVALKLVVPQSPWRRCSSRPPRSC